MPEASTLQLDSFPTSDAHVGCFFTAVIKCTDKNDVWEKGFVLDYSSRRMQSSQREDEAEGRNKC